jgi:hypothetical protein
VVEEDSEEVLGQVAEEEGGEVEDVAVEEEEVVEIKKETRNGCQ